MNEKELYVVKEYNFENRLITDIDSIIDSYFKNYHKIYFHNFNFGCIYDIKLTKITNIEIFL